MFTKNFPYLLHVLIFLVLPYELIGQSMKPLLAEDKGQARAGKHHYLSHYQDAGLGRMHTAVAVIGSADRVLHIDVNDQLGVDLIVPENIRLVHLGAAVIDLDGHSLGIEGPFTAGADLVFSGAGKAWFAMGIVERVLPQWWGENSSASVQKALDVAVECGAELFLPAGDYVFDTTVEFLFTGQGFNGRALSVRGSGPGNTIIDCRSASEPSFRFGTVTPSADTGLFLSIEGLEITSSTGTALHGIQIEDIWIGRISDCFIHDLSGDGILMRSDLNDVGLPKTWRIERSLIFNNSGYGIRFETISDITAAYNIVIDQVDIELNDAGGIFAEAELSKITNSIFAYNGSGLGAHGGIYIKGVPGYAVTENVIEGCGFEANYPYDIYADRFLNLKIVQNDMSRIEWMGGIKPDHFIRLNGPSVGINAVIADNHFVSAHPAFPFTAVLGGSELESVLLDNNRFNIMGTDKRFEFDTATKVTFREKGDTYWTNQRLGFADSVTAQKDTYIERSSAGIVKVTGGVANALQTVNSSFQSIVIDCSKGLNVAHTLVENTTVAPPTGATPGVVLNLIVFQGSGSYTIGFDPIFKVAEPFGASPLHFSSIRFLYTGLYWIQLGGAAIDAPL